MDIALPGEGLTGADRHTKFSSESGLLLHPLQLEQSGVQTTATSTDSMHTTSIHSLDFCSAGASIQHDIWQRRNVPFQSTQSALPSSPSFGFQEPLCSFFVNAVFCECSFLYICWWCKNINTTKSSLMWIAAAAASNCFTLSEKGAFWRCKTTLAKEIS